MFDEETSGMGGEVGLTGTLEIGTVETVAIEGVIVGVGRKSSMVNTRVGTVSSFVIFSSGLLDRRSSSVSIDITLFGSLLFAANLLSRL